MNPRPQVIARLVFGTLASIANDAPASTHSIRTGVVSLTWHVMNSDVEGPPRVIGRPGSVVDIRGKRMVWVLKLAEIDELSTS